MHTKTKLRGLAAAAAISLGIGGSPAGAEDLELLEPGVLKCAFSGSYAPFAMQDPQGKWSGLAIEVFREAADRVGIELEYVITK